MSKKALVLAGGGTRGSYQCGALHALRRMNLDRWDIVTGTSVGALNAVLVIQKDYDVIDNMYRNLKQDQIVNGAWSVDMSLNDMVSERAQVAPMVKDVLTGKGVDITPFREYIHRLYKPEKFFASDVDFGCITCHKRNKQPVYVTKEMLRDQGEQWLLATCSAYPAFPVCVIDGKQYVDGGYFDNLPIDLALQKGAEEVIAIDLNNEPQHPNYFDRTGITYIFPKVETGSFLSFERSTIDQLEVLGYNDTMKAFHVLDGVKYTFQKFALPGWFAKFRHDLLLLEVQIKLASNINERFASRQEITDKLCEQQHCKVISDEQMFFGLMDNLMDLAGCEVQKVYTYREARDAILAAFADCAKQNFLSENRGNLLNYPKTLDTKGVVSRMIHSTLYPSHRFFPDQVRLTVYPFEKALAMFAVAMMMELKEE